MKNKKHLTNASLNSPFKGCRGDLFKIKYFFIVGILLIINNILFAQKNCYADQIHEKLLQTDSVYKQKNIEKTALIYNKLIPNKIKTLAITDTSVKYIPIVVHVIHNGETIGTGSNISDAQIKATIDYTNKIYANAFGTSTNFKIQFVLVCTDKNGNTTSGIERLNGNTITGYAPQNQADLNDYNSQNSITNISQKLNWDIQKYYNIYIVEKFSINNVAGVAFYPNNYFFQSDASFVTASQFTSGNPTLPHELGHSLNLAHTFRDGCNTPTNNCLLDGDGVCDTPPHEQNDCSDLTTCLNQDNKNSKYNYMSYCHVYGISQNLFTLGQKQRANASLDLISRASLINNAYNVASCNINVKKYTITTKVINGTISNTLAVDSNSNFTVTYSSFIKPMPDSIFINNISVPVNASNINSFNFTNIVSNQLIKVVYNIDTSTINDTSKCNRIIFKDDFNNNKFDTNFWVKDAIDTNDIRVESGIMKLEQNFTDRKTYLYSKWFNVDSTSSILIERNALIHVNGNQPSYISMSLNFNDSVILCDHPFVSYFNNSYENLYGIYVNSDFRNYRDLCYQQRVRNVLFDNWFKEKFLYNFATGEYKYWLNDTLLGVGKFKKPGTSIRNFRLSFNPWSWNTGHYQYFDNFVLTEIKNCNTDSFITKGLILYLPFNGNTKDQIDTNNAVNKGATLTSDRKDYCNRAYSFNGIDNSMDIPYNRNLLPNYDKKTYSFWLKFKDSTSQFTIQNGDADLSGGQFILQVSANNKNGFMSLGLNSYWNVGGGSDMNYFFPANFNYTMYHLYTYTIDSLKTEYFIDGIKVATKLWSWAYKPFDAPTITNPYNNITYTNNIRIGYYLNTASFGAGGYNGFFKGSLDELRIYNRILSNTEIYKLSTQTPLDDPLADKTSCSERKIIATEVKNGLITPITAVTKGLSTRIQYQPANTNARLDSIYINNMYIGKDSNNGFTFTNVQTDQKIKVVYALSNNSSIFSINKSIIKTNDSLIVTGNNISFLKFKSYPDSGEIKIKIKRAVPNANPLINTIDTQYYFIIPSNFENKLYQLRGIGYDNSVSNLKLIRVYNFDPDSVGLTTWGNNQNGQLNIPSSVKNIVQVTASEYGSAALTLEGNVIIWGGLEQPNIILNNIVKIEAGEVHILALNSDLNVIGWGANDVQQLNFNNNNNNNNIIDIYAGRRASLFLTSNDNLLGFGDNLAIIPTNAENKYRTANSGQWHSLVVLNSGKVIAWGDNNNYGQLSVPDNLDSVIEVSCGDNHSVALRANGQVVVWGDNSYGQLKPLKNNLNFKTTAAGWTANIALKKDGTIIEWDRNCQADFSFSNCFDYKPISLYNVINIDTRGGHFITLHRISVQTESNQGGTISPPTFLKYNDNYRVTYKANNNYLVDSIFINDIYQSQVSKDSLNGYTFRNVTNYASIRVVFKVNQTIPNSSIISINKSIIKTNDSLIVTGNNISYLKYKSYPDSGKINFIFKRAVPNPNDTQYYFKIPPNFDNKLYQLRGIGYDNSVSNLKLIRVYNFDPAYIGITAWNDKGRLQNIPNNFSNLIYIKSKFYSNVALDTNGYIYVWTRSNDQDFVGTLHVSPNLKNIVDFGQSGVVNTALNSDGQVFRIDNNGLVTPLNLSPPIINLDGNGGDIYGINENNFFTNIYNSNYNLNIGNLNIITAANASFYTLVNSNLINSYEFGVNKCQLNIPGIRDLSGASDHFIVLKNDSTAEAYNAADCIPVYLNNTNKIKNVVKISAEGAHSFISNKEGKVLDFGSISMQNPSKLEGIVSVSTGYNYTIALNLLYVYTSIENGTITLSKTVKRGSALRVTFIPNTGYKIDSIFINDAYSPQATRDSLVGFTFKNINSTQIIRVVCKQNLTIPIPPQYCITTQAINGNISPKICIDSGTNYRITYSPLFNFKLDSIFINDIYQSQVSKDSLKGYTFKNLTNNASIRVVFIPPPPPPPKFCITTQAINGNISPKICLDSGTNYRITYTPLFNFRLDSIFINNIYNEFASKDSFTGFTFYKINQNNEIKVIFFSSDKTVEPSDILTPTVLDGQFDNWQITNIDTYPENEISIYNQFYIEVINFENYKNENPWTGLDKYGTKLISGVYYYIIKLKYNNQVVKILKGTITLMN